jgi:hypothetical protein
MPTPKDDPDLQLFIDALYKAGWQAPCDAQHEFIVGIYDRFVTQPGAAAIKLKRQEVTASILRSAARMAKLLKVDAPGLVIEMERSLLANRIAAFPVEAEHQLAAQQTSASIKATEQEHLLKTGYYDNLEDILGAEPKSEDAADAEPTP